MVSIQVYAVLKYFILPNHIEGQYAPVSLTFYLLPLKENFACYLLRFQNISNGKHRKKGSFWSNGQHITSKMFIFLIHSLSIIYWPTEKNIRTLFAIQIKHSSLGLLFHKSFFPAGCRDTDGGAISPFLGRFSSLSLWAKSFTRNGRYLPMSVKSKCELTPQLRVETFYRSIFHCISFCPQTIQKMGAIYSNLGLSFY